MDECPICMENLKFNNRKIHTTSCNHKFHEMCFKKVKNGACPCCRAIIPLGIAIVISNIKTEIRDVKSAFTINKKMRKDKIAAKSKIISTLRKEETTEKNVLAAMIKTALSKRQADDLDVVLWISSQEERIKRMEKERERHFLKIVMIESTYPIMINYYSDILLNMTKQLEEAQEKKRMGVIWIDV
jgi:gluconate kinase